ncbi:unnamed protein product [Nesidiocoris tenuis]|uniref:Uncharacterized protein n=1 Tax=Nesidiocoris tenuis TaxID=355587 RepID=A0A6H5G7W0_9HEMI|nr:unnamed protein product [Nesidiocoris tenuis]
MLVNFFLVQVRPGKPFWGKQVSRQLRLRGGRRRGGGPAVPPPPPPGTAAAPGLSPARQFSAGRDSRTLSEAASP